jgi:hypothetical protein
MREDVTGWRRKGSMTAVCAVALALALSFSSVPARAEGGSAVSMEAFAFNDYFFVVSGASNQVIYSVTVASGPNLRVLIMDYDNFIGYLTRSSFQPIIDVQASPSASGVVNLDEGEYVLVIDNQAGSSPAVFSFHYELGSGQVLGATPGDATSILLAIAVGAVVAVIAYSGFRRMTSSRGSSHPGTGTPFSGGPRPDEEETTPNQMAEPDRRLWNPRTRTMPFDYCNYCGERVHPGAAKCPRCGVRRPR